MSNTLLHAGLKAEGAMHGKGRSCHCCTYVGSTKNGRRNRQIERQNARRRENAAWRSEV